MVQRGLRALVMKRTTSALMAALMCVLVATACDEQTPSGPTVPLDAQFTLSPGESATVQGTSLRITFAGVTGDSRCPGDAFCIQGGDALVHIRAARGGNVAEYDLHTGDASRASVTHAGYRIALAELQPYPFSSRTIEPQDYRATLQVSR